MISLKVLVLLALVTTIRLLIKLLVCLMLPMMTNSVQLSAPMPKMCSCFSVMAYPTVHLTMMNYMSWLTRRMLNIIILLSCLLMPWEQMLISPCWRICPADIMESALICPKVQRIHSWLKQWADIMFIWLRGFKLTIRFGRSPMMMLLVLEEWSLLPIQFSWRTQIIRQLSCL